MPTGARLGFGTLLKIGDGGGPETFTTIAEILEIDPPGEEAELVEVTNHDSANRRREYIGGLVDGVELSGLANYKHSTQQVQLRTDLIAGTTRNFQCVVPTNPAKTYAFAAVVLKWQPRSPLEEQMKLEFTLKVTGDVTIT